MLAAGAASLFADARSVEISLGIRDSSYLPVKARITNPLAFRIRNTGRAAIKADDVPNLFFAGILHVAPEKGQGQTTGVQPYWRTSVQELPPGQIAESPDYANLRDFFPTLRDGIYRTWWTLKEAKSNILRFAVSKGKVRLIRPKT